MWIVRLFKEVSLSRKEAKLARPLSVILAGLG